MPSLPSLGLVPPENASALRQLLAQGRRLDLVFKHDPGEFRAALKDPAWRVELEADPVVGAQLLGMAIDTWDANRTIGMMEDTLRALLDAGAQPAVVTVLPRHWRITPRPERQRALGLADEGDLYGRGPVACMPLEWFLACHDPNPQTLDPAWEPPEALTAALFDAVDFANPDVDKAVGGFLGRARPAVPIPPGTAWLERRFRAAQLGQRLAMGGGWAKARM